MIDEDITRAQTLPAHFYRDPAAYERLRERVFAPSWQPVDGGERASGPGSVLPFTLLEGCVDEPLLLARDEAGLLRGLSNVCTHRGTILCPQAESGLRQLRCRYHGRRFGLDGRFQSMPEFNGVRDFPSPNDDLPRVATGTLGPLVFASLDPVLSFEAYMAPVRERMGFLPLDRLVPDPHGARNFQVNANWALYCDNFLEGFHIPFLHPALNKAVDFSTYKTELFPHGTLQIAEANSAEDAFAGTQVAAYYFFLFPNLMLNFYPWGLSVNVVMPQAVDRTRIIFRTYVLDPARMGRGAGSGLDRVEQEDEEIVEEVQRGISSRLYRRGRYSATRETGVHHFHRLLTRHLE